MRVPSCSNVATARLSDSLPLLLLGLEVEVGRAVVDLAEPLDGAGLEQELLGERGLAGAGVAGQDDASKVGGVDALHRHRRLRPSRSAGANGTVWAELQGVAAVRPIIVGYTPARDVRSFQVVHDQAREGRQ